MMNNEPLLHIPQFDPDQLFVRPDPHPDHDEGHRTIWINEQISQVTTQKLVDTLLRFDSAEAGVPIHLYIYSGGGCVVSGLAIISTMHHITSPVYTYAIGYAASMAAVILASGQRDHRYVLAGSFVMIHQASGGGGGTMENLRATLAWQSKLEAENERVLARACGRSEKEIQQASRVDNWMDAQEAKSFGLVDHILEPHPAKS
jgi:ATP-dependent Clp protease protease subunit